MNVGKCSSCGTPKRVATKHEWRNDGVIVSRESDLRGIWVESGLLHAVLDGIEEQLGVPIDHIVIDAKRRDAKLYVANLLKGHQEMLLGLKPIRRVAYLSTIRQASALGLANTHLLEYRPERLLVLRADHVYHEPLFAGDTCGAFEAIEGVRAVPSYGKVGRSTFLAIEASMDAPEDERLEPEADSTVPSWITYNRCPACGLPLEVSSWKWDIRDGHVEDGNTGEWIVFMNIGGFNAVFRELVRELGEDIPGLAAGLCRSYYEGLRDKHSRSPFNGLSFMKLRGFGTPEHENPTRDELSEGVVVRNAFNGPIVAGMVAAVYGKAGGDVSWEDTAPGTLTVRLD